MQKRNPLRKNRERSNLEKIIYRITQIPYITFTANVSYLAKKGYDAYQGEMNIWRSLAYDPDDPIRVVIDPEFAEYVENLASKSIEKHNMHDNPVVEWCFGLMDASYDYTQLTLESMVEVGIAAHDVVMSSVLGLLAVQLRDWLNLKFAPSYEHSPRRVIFRRDDMSQRDNNTWLNAQLKITKHLFSKMGGCYGYAMSDLERLREQNPDNFFVPWAMGEIYTKALFSAHGGLFTGQRKKEEGSRIAQQYGGLRYLYQINKTAADLWTRDMFRSRKMIHSFVYEGYQRGAMMHGYRTRFKEQLRKWDINPVLELADQANSLLYNFLAENHVDFFKRFDAMLWESNLPGVGKVSLVDKIPYLQHLNEDYRDREREYWKEQMHYPETKDRLFYMGALADNISKLRPVNAGAATHKRDKAYKELYRLVKKLTDEEKGDLIRAGQSKNGVYFMRDDFGGCELIFKEGSSLEQLEDEERLAYEIADIVEGTHFSVPRPITVFEADLPHTEQPIYIMEQVQGESLEEKVNRDDPDVGYYVGEICDALAWVHALVPETAYADEQTNHIAYLQKKLQKVEGIAKAEWMKGAMEYYEPIQVSLEQSVQRYYRDANLRNWLISPTNEIAIVDTENNGANAPEMDLAKVLLYLPTAYQQEEEDFLTRYAKSFNECSDESIEVSQLYGRVQHAKLNLLFTDTCDFLFRGQFNKLLGMEERISYTLEKIADNDWEFYSVYQRNYKELQNCILNLVPP